MRQGMTWLVLVLTILAFVALSQPTLAGIRAQSISAGASHTCAVTTGGGVQCWGSNANGGLGDGTTTDRWTPTPVSGPATGGAAVTMGEYHTCALTTGGGVLCWGVNVFGQVGDGTTTNRTMPTPVSGLASGMAAVAAGDLHTCALTTGGGVLCWGHNFDGQLGDGKTTLRRTTPMPVRRLASGVAAVAAGSGHTCAVTTGGGVLCWGRKDYGQLGDGTTTTRWMPTPASGLASGVATVAAGGSHTCALTTGGGVFCWGRNDHGQLGDGTTTDRPTPTPVSGLASGVAAVAAGGSHTCALMTGGGALCWGRNDHGQLGDATTTDRWAPTPVSGLATGGAAVATAGTTPVR